MSFKYQSRLQDPCVVCAKLDGSETDWPVAGSSTHAVAFVPSRQPHHGTTLVVPRRHVFDPAGLSDEEADDLYLLLRDMVDTTMSVLRPNYYHISQYVGKPGGEPFDHLHWRLEPRSDAPASKWMPIPDLPAVPLAERVEIAEAFRRYGDWVTASPAAAR